MLLYMYMYKHCYCVNFIVPSVYLLPVLININIYPGQLLPLARQEYRGGEGGRSVAVRATGAGLGAVCIVIGHWQSGTVHVYTCVCVCE